MTPRGRPDGGDARACAACDAPLAADQRWCLACGARVAGASPAELLAPLAARPAAAAPPPPGAAPVEASPAPPPSAVAASPHAAPSAFPAPPRPDAAAASPLAADAAQAARSAQLLRRRRAAAPLALAALVGVLVAGAGASTAPAGLSQQPFTVVLPPLAQVAQAVADDPPPADPAPADDTFAEEPLADEPLAEEPLADEAPAAEEPAETPADDESEDDDGQTTPEPISPVKHVFLIVLASTDVAALAGDEAQAPYLAGTLAKSGTLLTDYRAVARGALANRIALVSGQGPTAQTLADCPAPADGAAPADVRPADALADGQTGGDGCLYGYETGTIADQLAGAGKRWRAYVEPAAGAARAASAASPSAARAASPVPPGAARAARAPAARAGAEPDCLPAATTTRRNPFLWFRGLAEADDCAERNAPLSRLASDLDDPDATPTLSFIASDAQLGSTEADAFLQRVVPQIQNSLAYADGGLIVITSDQPPAAPPAPANPAPPAPPAPEPPAGTTPAPTPPAATTPEPAPPTATAPAPAPPTATTAAPTPPTGTASPWPATYPNVGDAAAAGAGAPVGALLISPFTPAGRADATPASHFTLLRTLAGLFGFDPLGYAAAEHVEPLPDALLDGQP